MILTGALALALLGGCDMIAAGAGANETGDDAANAAAPQDIAGGNAGLAQPVVPQIDLAGARALIDRIYQPYTRDEISDSLGDIYTPELTAAIERQSDPDMGLGYDPFCSCQDFGQFSYTIVSLEPAEGGAAARVTRSNFGESSSVTFNLAYRGGRWLVGDIIDENGSLLNGN